MAATQVAGAETDAPTRHASADQLPSDMRPQRARGSPLTEVERAEIIRRHKAGEGDRRIAKAMGIHKMTVYKVKREAGLLRGNTVIHGPPDRREPSSRPSSSGKPGGGKRMAEEEGDLKLTVARLQWERERDREREKDRDQKMDRLVEAMGSLTKKPLKSELHDGALHVECPNCATATEVPLPAPSARVGDFSQLLDMMDRAGHDEGGGKNFLSCPTCGPKATEMFAKWGYVPKPTAPPEED